MAGGGEVAVEAGEELDLDVFVGERGDYVRICEEEVVRNEESRAETGAVAVDAKQTYAVEGEVL